MHSMLFLPFLLSILASKVIGYPQVTKGEPHYPNNTIKLAKRVRDGGEGCTELYLAGSCIQLGSSIGGCHNCSTFINIQYLSIRIPY